MTTTTSVFLPDEQEQQITKKPPQSVRPSGHASAASESTAPDDTEIQKLNEEQLKAAIVSAWKKLERIGKKEMGGLLYWLRERLRAQGTRNDLRNQDKGFGTWVQQTIEISRRTADRWANHYGYEQGLMKRKVKPTSGQGDQMFEDTAFYEEEQRKHGRMVQMNLWLKQADFKRYESAVKILRRHFKTTSSQEALWKGALYAAETICGGRGTSVGKAKSPRVAGHKQKATPTSRHRARRSQEVNRHDARPKAFRAAAG
jgi:hypothetical protein